MFYPLHKISSNFTVVVAGKLDGKIKMQTLSFTDVCIWTSFLSEDILLNMKIANEE